ncbi:MAG: isoprenylcysteine carboxylmethyltransferase family protein [Proteobacteria bacterium]|nr:isoprenylcysteine carboxylmethyltransferase family protein [Pseudomonadota bacterium]MBS0494902.1 isoprenylcysteine carboxylmethyltransferase family protein [Pseudomonadota bacterium]
MLNLEHKIPPPVVGLACAALAWWLTKALPALILPLPQRLALAVALLLGLGGLALELWGLITFRRHRTTPNPMTPERASTVMQSGPYRLTRNPMYLGVALQLLAWCLYLRSPLALLALAVFLAYITRFQILPEERLLRQKFGSAYEDYLQRVRRWI